MADRDGGDDLERPPATLDDAAVWRLATGYLARYAASSHRLRQALERQVRRWHERRALPPEPATMAALVESAVRRAQDLALVDDHAFALARARHHAAKGLPANEVRRRLKSERLESDPDTVEAALDGDDAAQARRFARRKRLGPFRPASREIHRDKDVRRVMRAGFAFRDAAAAIDGSSDDDAD